MNNLRFVTHSMPTTLSFKTVAMFVVLLLAVTGCSKSTEITTNAAGHQIRAHIVGNHSIESHSDQGVISSPFGKVTVERARVQVEGAPWAAIPEGVPVKVNISKGKVRVNAGRVTVVRTVG